VISIDDIFVSDVDELESLLLQKLQSQTTVLKHLRAEARILDILAIVDFLGRNDLNKVDEQDSIGQILS